MQSPHKIGRARTNPLAAPARELPAGHPTVTEAQLRRLDHPGPLREHAATGNLAPARSLAGRRMRAPLHRRPRGRLSVAPLPPWSAPCAPRTLPMLLLAPRPAPAARASVRQPLRPGQPPPGGLPWPAGPAPVARGGGAVAALKPAPARQTGRGESWATRVRALGGAEAAEKSSQVKSSQTTIRKQTVRGRTQRATTNEARTHAAWLQL